MCGGISGNRKFLMILLWWYSSRSKWLSFYGCLNRRRERKEKGLLKLKQYPKYHIQGRNPDHWHSNNNPHCCPASLIVSKLLNTSPPSTFPRPFIAFGRQCKSHERTNDW